MPVAAVIGAVGAIGGGLIAASGAKKAAKTQADAANKATDVQMQMYGQTREDLMPYSETGKGALYSLADLYGLPTPENPAGGQPLSEDAIAAFQRSPDYEVARREGIGALDASAAKKGMLLSGAQVKALADYGADLGSANFGNYVNRLMQLVDTGRGAASQTGQFAGNAARGIAATTLDEGEATAAGQVSAFNNIAGGVTDAFKDLATYNSYRNPNPSSYVRPRANPLYS